MTQYLLDTNICIYFIKGLYQLDSRINSIGADNCFISEVTVAELKYGVANSNQPALMKPIIEAFIPKFAILPVYDALDIYAAEKARLRKSGSLIDDFDILIGATAIQHQLILVTNNVSHLGRLQDIVIENWAK
ncbi:type II toxin-antitoxin system VapC family toxin [Dyadobacter sandarakinus]|uniref:Type II toxin-antitoxin system VapC family toxin n=1 Tax=Dyadobacter sandarakinus TaxID=2747268 RepID=A0ABX7IBR9_9BACT|nr:type II toxin-antitoxin system VapC family toxin [Dyadobacter sandarakinus]QRR03549.1 type II toxin-antitoxin system VapC family toxin [Dyadobacter sandarakinus]